MQPPVFSPLERVEIIDWLRVFRDGSCGLSFKWRKHCWQAVLAERRVDGKGGQVNCCISLALSYTRIRSLSSIVSKSMRTATQHSNKRLYTCTRWPHIPAALMCLERSRKHEVGQRASTLIGSERFLTVQAWGEIYFYRAAVIGSASHPSHYWPDRTH